MELTKKELQKIIKEEVIKESRRSGQLLEDLKKFFYSYSSFDHMTGNVLGNTIGEALDDLNEEGVINGIEIRQVLQSLESAIHAELKFY